MRTVNVNLLGIGRTAGQCQTQNTSHKDTE
jgi:hypothetical protein